MTAKRAKVEPGGKANEADTFDAQSAEVADVAQVEDEKQDPPAVGQKESDLGSGVPPGHLVASLTANLKKLEDTVVSRQIGFSEDLARLEKKQADTASLLSGGFEEFGKENRRLEEQVNKKAPAELEEKIAEVSSKHGQSIAELGQELKARVVEHHDRLLELEMKVTGLTEGGKDEEQPG